MSHNQDLAKIFNGLESRRKGQTSPEKLACNFSVIHFVVDLERIHLTGAPIRRIFVQFNLCQQ